jgi:hypothetical protein
MILELKCKQSEKSRILKMSPTHHSCPYIKGQVGYGEGRREEAEGKIRKIQRMKRTCFL